MAKVKQVINEIFTGFKESPLATLCVLLVVGFCFVYNDLRSINAEQRVFISEMQKSQNLMNESLQELNIRMENIEHNFTTTPAQLKELILLLHKQELE